MSTTVSYSYLPFPYQDPASGEIIEIFRPYLPIRLSYLHGHISYQFDALLDTGADHNLFPLQFADLIGINFKKIQPIKIYGIGDNQITGYTSNLNIWFHEHKFNSQANFSRDQKIPLLGRNGFFNLFKKVSILEQDRFIEITI